MSSRDRRFVYYMGFTELVDRPGRNAPRITFGEAAGGSAGPDQGVVPAFTSTGHRFLYR